jgi:hypothetical protein
MEGTELERIGSNMIKMLMKEYPKWEMKYEIQLPNSYRHRFDGTLSYNGKIIRIEYDGFQHFDPNSYWFKQGKSTFEDQRNRDKLKEYSVYEKNESLIRVCHLNKYKDSIEYLRQLLVNTIRLHVLGYNVLITINDKTFKEKMETYQYDDLYTIALIHNKFKIGQMTINEFINW